MFKTPLCACFLALALTCTAFSADEETKKEKDMLRVGDRLRLHAVSPVTPLNQPVTIVSFGKKDWVLVEYDFSFVKAGESGAKTEKRQLWVNLDKIIAAEKIASPSLKEE